MDSEPASPALVSSDVDWITLTETRKGRKARLQNLAIPLLESESRRGNITRNWGMAGYEGLCCGQCQLGTGSQGAIVRLSSAMAGEQWRALAQHADGCSRLDLQLTIRHPTKVDHLIARHFRQASTYRKLHGNISTVSLFRSSDGSATLYLGKRISERFGRAYDKEKESGQLEWSRCIRYELELKGSKASLALAHLSRTRAESYHLDPKGALALPNGNAVSQSTWISSTVSGFFLKRGVRLDLPPLPAFPIGNTAPATDLERKLAWAKKCLAPTVAIFASHGKLTDFLSAIGVQCIDGKLVVATTNNQ